MVIEQYSRSKLEAKIRAQERVSLPNKLYLSDDGDWVETLFPEIAVPFDCDLPSSDITIDALCKDTPRKLLRYGHTRRSCFGWWAHEIPSRRSPGQEPLPAAFAGDLQQKCSPDRRINVPIDIRQSPHEAIQDWVIQIRRH